KVNDQGLQSTAAGFLQAILRTWTGAADVMGITDFSPNSQRLVAVELIRQRGAMSFILRGDLPGAFANSSLRNEWASFPGAGYGQHENTLQKLQAVFNAALQKGTAIVGIAAENPGASSAVIIVAGLLFFS
ncbi:MAG: hypothetical protein ACR2MG_21000, partial [Pyrinomonadaceae bacterium]